MNELLEIQEQLMSQKEQPSDGKVVREYQKTNYRADDPDTTMWKDIFDKKFTGTIANDIYQAKVKVEGLKQKIEIQETNAKEQFQKEEEASSSVSGFSNLDADEQEMVEALREKKKVQIEEYASLQKFGMLININRATYTQEVQQKCHVIIHISSDHLPQCKKMNHFCTLLADKFPTVKFCKIPFQDAADGFPEQLCPTILIYSNGKMIGKLNSQEMGNNFTADALEWKLSEIGVVQTDLEADPLRRVKLDDWVRDQM